MSRRIFKHRQLQPFSEKVSIRDYLTLALFITCFCMLCYFGVRWIIKSDDPIGYGVLAAITIFVVVALFSSAARKSNWTLLASLMAIFHTH